MKKFLSLTLAALLSVSAASCGAPQGEPSPGAAASAAPGAAVSAASSKTPASTPTPTPEPTPTPVPDPAFQTVASGEKITLDFVEITIGDLNHGAKLKEGNTALRPSSESNEFFWLSAVLTNTTGESYRVWGNTMVKIIFDDKYTYEGDVQNFGSPDMAPLMDNNIYLYAEVPPRVLDYQSVTVQFAFNDGFAEYDYEANDYEQTMEGYDHLYQFTSGGAAGNKMSAAADADTIDAALQGTWSVSGGTFAFEGGAVKVDTQGQSMSGTYTIDTEKSEISGSFQATNGTVNITLPYTYADGVLTVYNNAGEAFQKA